MSLFHAAAAPALQEPATPALPFVSPGVASSARRTPMLATILVAGRRLLRLCLGPLLPSKSRRLRVNETVSLGDKRFLSIVEVDGVDYLIGGGTASIALLTRLGQSAADPSFQQAVSEAWSQPETA